MTDTPEPQKDETPIEKCWSCGVTRGFHSFLCRRHIDKNPATGEPDPYPLVPREPHAALIAEIEDWHGCQECDGPVSEHEWKLCLPCELLRRCREALKGQP